MNIPPEVLSWMSEFGMQMDQRRVAGGMLATFNLRLYDHKLKLVFPTLPSSVGQMGIEKAEIKLRELLTANIILDEAAWGYGFFDQVVEQMPDCFMRDALERVLIGFIASRLLSLSGSNQYGYDDAVTWMRKFFLYIHEDDHKIKEYAPLLEFNHAWKVVSDFRNKVYAHVDAESERYSKGIENRLSLSFTPSKTRDQGGDFTFTDEALVDGKVVSFLGTTRPEEHVKDAIRTIMKPRTNNLRSIAWFMEEQWRKEITKWRIERELHTKVSKRGTC